MYPFSKEIIDELGLQLFPSHWKYISPGCEWEYREPKERSLQNFGEYSDTYEKALELVNYLRTNPNDQIIENCRLEQRLARFERLYGIGAPTEIIRKEIELLKKSIKEIKK